MNRIRTDRRDPLLLEVYQPGDASLATRMAARIRRRRRVRQSVGAAAVLAIAALLTLRTATPARETPSAQPAKTSSAALASTTPAPASAHQREPEPANSAPAVPAATDAELLAHLEHERVIVFTLADGQRQVVWLDGNPRG